MFSIPKILQRYFLYDRGLLLELSRCIWETLKIYYQTCRPGKNSFPGAVIAIQTFGDFLGFNPHGHVLITEFQVYCGPRFLPREKTAMENLARYIIRASFSQSRLRRDICRNLS